MRCTIICGNVKFHGVCSAVSRRFVWGAHAPRVLVSAPRRNDFCLSTVFGPLRSGRKRRLSDARLSCYIIDMEIKLTGARPVFCAFVVVAAVALAGLALAAGPEHPSAQSSKSQIV